MSTEIITISTDPKEASISVRRPVASRVSVSRPSKRKVDVEIDSCECKPVEIEVSAPCKEEFVENTKKKVQLEFVKYTFFKKYLSNIKAGLLVGYNYSLTTLKSTGISIMAYFESIVGNSAGVKLTNAADLTIAENPALDLKANNIDATISEASGINSSSHVDFSAPVKVISIGLRLRNLFSFKKVNTVGVKSNNRISFTTKVAIGIVIFRAYLSNTIQEKTGIKFNLVASSLTKEAAGTKVSQLVGSTTKVTFGQKLSSYFSNRITNKPAFNLTRVFQFFSANSNSKPALKISAQTIFVSIFNKPAFKTSYYASLRPAFLKNAPKLSSIFSFRINGIPSTKVNQRGSGTPKLISDVPGANMVQILYNLTHNKGSSAVTQSPVGGRTDWQNISNAQGNAPNTANATITGNLLSAIAGRLDFDFSDFVGKTDLTIVKVELHFYVQQSGVLAGGGTMQLQMSKSASVINLQNVTGNVNNLTTPIVIDITSNITSWSDLNALKAYVSFNNPSGRLSTGAVNAVHVNILASQTQLL